MIDFYRLDLKADKFAPFAAVIAFVNADLTGAAYAMQVRPVPNEGGTALLDLATVTDPGQLGVRTIDVTTDSIANLTTQGILSGPPAGTNPATGKHYAAADSVTVSRVGIFIPEADLEALELAQEPATDLVLFYDLLVTPAGGQKDKLAGGRFIVRAGVTQ